MWRLNTESARELFLEWKPQIENTALTATALQIWSEAENVTENELRQSAKKPQSLFLALGAVNHLCGEMFARSITQSARKQLTQTRKKSCARSIEKAVKAASTRSRSRKRQSRKIRTIPSTKSKKRQRSLAQHTAR